MKLQQYLLNHYLHIPFEDFSERAVHALGILRTIRHNPFSDMDKEKIENIEKSILRVQEIIEVTRQDIQVSLYILDRNIAPQDFSKNAVNHVLKFQRKKKVNGQDYITMSSDQIQKALCEAGLEIHEILMVELAGFSEQMFFESDEL